MKVTIIDLLLIAVILGVCFSKAATNLSAAEKTLATGNLSPRFNLLAHMQAKGIVKERMDLMKLFASAMRKKNLELRNFSSRELALIVYEAKLIADNSGKLITLFPAGSGGGVSEASPKIWESPGDFKEKISAFMGMPKELEENINTSDLNNLIRIFRTLAATCKNCHRDYRVKNAL